MHSGGTYRSTNSQKERVQVKPFFWQKQQWLKMPNRIVREAILTSERIAKLGWPEEVFYRRLMSVVDDYGRYEANPQLLRSKCYPLQVDDVRVADITRWTAACQKAGLILVYAVHDKQYLEVSNFGQQQRSVSKFPPPIASDINCYQPPSDAHLGVFVSGGVDVSEVVSVKETPRKRSASSSGPSKPDDVEMQTWEDWMQLRKTKRAPVTETVLNGAREEAEKAGMTLESFLKIWCARGSQGMQADWLKPAERGVQPGKFGASTEPAWRTEQRERTQQAAPGVAVGNPNEFFNKQEPIHVTPRIVG